MRNFEVLSNVLSSLSSDHALLVAVVAILALLVVLAALRLVGAAIKK